MHLDQSALGILRKAEDKCGRKYMIGGYRIWISQGLSWSINPTAGMRSIRFISLRVRQAIARANTCIQPTEVSRWKMVH